MERDKEIVVCTEMEIALVRSTFISKLYWLRINVLSGKCTYNLKQWCTMIHVLFGFPRFCEYNFSNCSRSRALILRKHVVCMNIILRYFRLSLDGIMKLIFSIKCLYFFLYLFRPYVMLIFIRMNWIMFSECFTIISYIILNVILKRSIVINK